MKKDLDFLKSMLPEHYEITSGETNKGGNWIKCASGVGLRVNGNDDKEQWDYVEKAIDNHFGERLQEIYFNTHSYYSNFVVYFKESYLRVLDGQL